jgi:hypothetical protein
MNKPINLAELRRLLDALEATATVGDYEEVLDRLAPKLLDSAPQLLDAAEALMEILPLLDGKPCELGPDCGCCAEIRKSAHEVAALFEPFRNTADDRTG